MTREEVERLCEQISDWAKFSSRPFHQSTLRILAQDAEQRKQIAAQAMEITTCNLALLGRDREIERLKADLEQVVEEAVTFAEYAQMYIEIPQILDDSLTFLTSPLVQSWRGRQKKEPS